MLREALNGRQTDWCDVVFEGVWIEVKHSWTWHTYRDPSSVNDNYWKHLFGESGTSALQDARVKLPRLIGHEGVDIIGLLLIELDSDQRPHSQSDIDMLEHMGAMDQQPWKRYPRPRWRSEVPGYESIRIQPVMWLRTAKITEH